MHTNGIFDRIILHVVWKSYKTLSFVVNLNLSDIILLHAKAIPGPSILTFHRKLLSVIYIVFKCAFL